MPAAIAASDPVTNPDGTDRIDGLTTNVNELPWFGDRVRTRVLGGTPVTGWWAQDFAPAEIKQLRAVERLPFRDATHCRRQARPILSQTPFPLCPRARRDLRRRE